MLEVIRRQAKIPAGMSLKNPKLALVRISTRRAINASDSMEPVIRNNDWK